MDRILEEILRLTVFLAAAGGLAIALAKFSGQKLIEHQFNKSLEAAKAKHSAFLDRTIKLHQYEFQVLPEAWERLHVAGGSCSSAVQRTVRRIEVASLTGDQLKIVLTNLEISQLDSDHILSLEGEARQNAFDKAEGYHKWNLARRDQAEFHNYLLSHGIFMPRELLQKFKLISKLLRDAISEHEGMLNLPNLTGSEQWVARDAFSTAWPAMIADLEADVFSRLWSSQALRDKGAASEGKP